MNEEKILDAIGEIDDSIIAEADRIRALQKPKKHPNSRILATAACAVLVLGLTLVTVNFMRNNLLTNEGEAYDAVLKSPEGTVPELLNRIPEEVADIEADGDPDGFDVLKDDAASASGAETVPETRPEAAGDIIVEETVPSPTMPDTAPEAETAPVGSFVKYPDVTVTVDYESHNHSSAVPTVTVAGNDTVSEKINSNEKLAATIRDSICFDGIGIGSVTYVKASEASLTISYYVYCDPGGPHPMHFVKYFNFSLENGELLDITDVLVSSNPDAADTLENAVADALSKAEQDYKGDTVFISTAGTIAAKFISGEANDKWYLTENGLRITYSPYDIAHYAAGYISVEIPYDDIPGVIDERFIPRSDTNGSIQIRESLNTAPWLVAYGDISDLAIRANVNGAVEYVVVYYRSRLENGERINLGSYRNYWFTYNASDGFEYVPYENVPGNPPYTVLYGDMGLPSDPEPISKLSLHYENGGYTGENLAYTDNATLKITDDGVEFSFSFYQDALDYIGDMHSFIRSLVTVDYEGNRYDVIDKANSIISVTVNGKSAKLTEISLGKGNGHEDFYFRVISTEGENPFTDGLNEFTFKISMEE